MRINGLTRAAVSTLLLVCWILPSEANAQAAPKSQPYAWKSVQIVGGGFVDGIVFHPAVKGLSYSRTDIGGAYRRDDQRSPWVPITDWVSIRDVNQMGPESIALDPNDPDKVYIATGMYATTNAVMLRSNDRGRTFQTTPVPFGMGGNADGRGNGERLAVDPNDGKILFFGSRSAGLWTSVDGSATWKKVDSFPQPVAAPPATAPVAAAATTGPAGRGAGAARGGRAQGSGIIFVIFDPRTGNKGTASTTLYAGASLTNQNNLFRSTDGGKTWEPVTGGPTNVRPTHAAWGSDGVLYVTYGTSPGPSDMRDGALWKYNTNDKQWTDITPEKPDPANNDRAFGYGAVSVDAQHPDALIVSSFHRREAEGGEELWRSTNGGTTWTGIIHNGKADSIYDYTNHPYTAHTPIHWLLDIEIDPFDSNHAMFTTGYGGWETFNLTDIDSGKPVKWECSSRGIEETVALSMVSPTDGPAHLISAIGDYGGFVHWDLDKPSPEGNFMNPFFGNTNDVAIGAKNPNVVVRVGTLGHGLNLGAPGTLGYSLDGGKTWAPPKTSPGGSNGFISVSNDGARWIWAAGGGGRGAAGGGTAVSITSDHGDTWAPCQGLPNGTRVIADPINPQKFYAMTLNNGTLFTSTDGGLNFTSSPMNLPNTGAAGGRGRGDNRGGQDKIYATPDKEGDLWLASYDGLFHSTDAGQHFTRVDPTAREIQGFGFGKGAPGADGPAIFVVGTVGDVHGVFRSDDGANTWTRINDDQHQWGLILHVIGDPRIYGRAYVGTHGRGILYGDLPK